MTARAAALLACCTAALVACGPAQTSSLTMPAATVPVTTIPVTTIPVTTMPVTTLPIATAPVTVPATVPATAAPDGTALALDVLGGIEQAKEHRGGYDRDLFGYPASFGGGCDTRAMVLQRDSLSPAQIDAAGCTVVAGDWYSVYDGVTYDQPSELEIDHVVALKEAWDSGAWQWNIARLEAFANDIDDVRSLRAVSSHTNRSKSDKDPSNWLPPNGDDVCRYVGDWVTIKARWQLSMDTSEYGRIRNVLRGPCAGWRVATWDAPPVPLD